MSFKTKYYLCIAFPIQIAIVVLISQFPSFVEQVYSQGVYPYISTALRYVFGWIPFSIGDVLYGLLFLLLFRFLFRVLVQRKIGWTAILLDIGSTLSIAYAMFHLLWGFNYYRVPLHQNLDISDRYTQAELTAVTKRLIAKSNAVHQKLTTVDSLPIHIPYEKDEIFKKTIAAYQQLADKYPYLGYSPKSIKTSLISLPLTYMGFSGYLNPFTNEAQVNGKIPNFKTPTTSCHEEAHQLGFAKENEANFIAALATIHFEDLYFRYSGLTFALRFCLNTLYSFDEQKVICMLEQDVKSGIRKNYQEVTDFWMPYENPLEPILKSTYNSYLKANNQPQGLETYNYVVALLVNYYKNNPL